MAHALCVPRRDSSRRLPGGTRPRPRASHTPATPLPRGAAAASCGRPASCSALPVHRGFETRRETQFGGQLNILARGTHVSPCAACAGRRPSGRSPPAANSRESPESRPRSPLSRSRERSEFTRRPACTRAGPPHKTFENRRGGQPRLVRMDYRTSALSTFTSLRLLPQNRAEVYFGAPFQRLAGTGAGSGHSTPEGTLIPPALAESLNGIQPASPTHRACVVVTVAPVHSCSGKRRARSQARRSVRPRSTEIDDSGKISRRKNQPPEKSAAGTTCFALTTWVEE